MTDDKLQRTASRLLDLCRVFGKLLFARQLAFEQLAVTDHDPQDVVEVMRNAAR